MWRRARPPYPPQLRARLVELARTGRTPEELGRQFEPSAQTIRNWLRQADRDDGRRADGLTTEERDEVRRLRPRRKALREEREILRKAAGPGSPGRPARLPVQGFEFVTAHEAGSRRGHRVPGAGRLRQRVVPVENSVCLFRLNFPRHHRSSRVSRPDAVPAHRSPMIFHDRVL